MSEHEEPGTGSVASMMRVRMTTLALTPPRRTDSHAPASTPPRWPVCPTQKQVFGSAQFTSFDGLIGAQHVDGQVGPAFQGLLSYALAVGFQARRFDDENLGLDYDQHFMVEIFTGERPVHVSPTFGNANGGGFPALSPHFG